VTPATAERLVPTAEPDRRDLPVGNPSGRVAVAGFRAGRGFARVLQRSRILKYRALSTCRQVSGTPIVIQPVLFAGEGEIVLGVGVEFGWPTSSAFYTGYSHLEASFRGALIEIGDGAQINNNAFIKSEGPGIRIGRDALLGSSIEILDSDFHDLDPVRRRGGRPAMAAVEIGQNAFIGDGSKILKGVTIGTDSVIGAGSIVTRSIPAGVLAAGNPARVIRELRDGNDGRPNGTSLRGT
jgi:acetyltransferase-like isoleucine patch superfamily enzyme